MLAAVNAAAAAVPQPSQPAPNLLHSAGSATGSQLTQPAAGQPVQGQPVQAQHGPPQQPQQPQLGPPQHMSAGQPALGQPVIPQGRAQPPQNFSQGGGAPPTQDFGQNGAQPAHHFGQPGIAPAHTPGQTAPGCPVPQPIQVMVSAANLHRRQLIITGALKST